MAVDWTPILQTGIQVAGAFLGAREQRRAARYTARAPIYYPPQERYYAPTYEPPSYDLGGVPTPSPYEYAAYQGGLPVPTQAGVGALIGAGARAATPALRGLVTTLSRWLTPVAAFEAAQALVAGGFGGGGRQPVYVRASDNATVGIMRGDLKAIKRVKRMGPRLTRALRSAGYGRSRGGKKQMRRAAPRRAALSPTALAQIAAAVHHH